MKTIENKKSDILLRELGEKKATYFELIHYCLNMTPQGGFTFDEMKKRLRIADAVNINKDSAELEDADFDKLKECLKLTRWISINHFLTDFETHILSL